MARNVFNSPTGGLFRLLRPADLALAFAAAVAAARLAASLNLRASAWAAAAITVAVAGAYVNKAWVYSREYLFVRPLNPIATALVREDEAKWLGWGLLAVGVAAAATLGVRSFATAFLAAALLLACNYFFEKFAATRILAGVIVAVVPALYGGTRTNGDIGRLTWVLAFLVGAATAVGLYNAVENRDGDAVAKRRSVAAGGGRGPLLLAGLAVCAAAAAAVIPVWTEGASLTYVAAAGGVASVMVLYAALNLRRRSPDPLFAGSTARMLKFLVFVFLAATYLESGWRT